MKMLAEPMREEAVQPVNGSVAIEQSRAIQEVQGAVFMAKKFPRDEIASYNRIMESCKRKSLAESAMYAYPRGGQMVTGPSIRLAETIAKSWGNIQFGIVELEQGNGHSNVLAYAWDLETNTRVVKDFKVPHERHTKKGVTRLTDPRDIYELIANQGARRLRACILGVIPGDVTEAAVEQCDKTLNSQTDEPLVDRIKKAVVAFASFGITQPMIEKRLGHKMESTTQAELVNLQKIYRSLKDGMASVDQFFDTPTINLEEENKAQAEASNATIEEEAENVVEPAESVAPAQQAQHTYYDVNDGAGKPYRSGMTLEEAIAEVSEQIKHMQGADLIHYRRANLEVVEAMERRNKGTLI